MLRAPNRKTWHTSPEASSNEFEVRRRAIKTVQVPTINVPDYGGGSIINLVAEIEARMGGSPPSPRLNAVLRDEIPQREGYVLVVFDGLGSDQLSHQSAEVFRRVHTADIDTVFPATTTVALASIVTALAPSQHGLLGYQLWMRELDTVVNTIKWTTLWGAPVDFDTTQLLPAPNLWERLARLGVQSYTIQPAHFDRSPLSRALYRGCRFEPSDGVTDLVDHTVRLAQPGRILLTYVPHVDFAAHVHGQDSTEYSDAITIAGQVWAGLESRIPANIALIGTADHGHVDFPSPSQCEIAKVDHRDRVFYGDGRAMFVKGRASLLADSLPAIWVPGEDTEGWWGPGPLHPEFAYRRPDGILVADDHSLLLHRFSDDRMVGHHGAMTPAEQRVPMMVGRSL